MPSYRTEDFIDPKGRGKGRGYDVTQGLQAMNNGSKDSIDMFATNAKKYDVLPGTMDFTVDKVDNGQSEIGGTFISFQPSDADMGSKEPTTLQIRGKWFAKVSENDSAATTRYKNIDAGKGSYIEKSTSYGPTNGSAGESKMMNTRPKENADAIVSPAARSKLAERVTLQ